MKKLLTIVAFVMLLLLMSTGVALALPAGTFELDGNALDSNAKNVLPDDWDSLFPGKPVTNG